MSDSEIADEELLRLINLIQNTRSPLRETVPGADVDAGWQIVSHLVRCQIVDQPVTLMDLIAASGLPYTTAHRRITQMLEKGLIVKRSAQPARKSNLLLPSPKLRRSVESYAHQIKVLLTELTGNRGDSERDENYTFGGSRKGLENVLPPANLRQPVSGSRHGLKFLFHDDNYFRSLRNWWTDFRANVGNRRDFTLASLPALYETILRNSTLPCSAFDVVALNLPWLHELASKGLIAPLDDERGGGLFDRHDFHPTIWHCGTWGSRQYAAPLYITIEFLTVRTDLFESANLPYPKTLKQLLESARKLHRPKRGQYGIVWNGARGMPIASTFMFLLAAHGGALLTKVENVRPRLSMEEQSRTAVNLNTPEARATLRFMLKLLEVSTPDVLDGDPDSNLNELMVGRAAMGYIWTMRAARLEYDPRSKVKGLVKYLAHPNVSGVRCTAPMGGYVLAIPSNLPRERMAMAIQAIKWLTSSIADQTAVRSALPVAPFFSVATDSEMAATSSIVKFVDQLERQGLLNNNIRPDLPEYKLIEDVLGTEIHDVMTGRKTIEDGLRDAQGRIDDMGIGLKKPATTGA